MKTFSFCFFFNFRAGEESAFNYLVLYEIVLAIARKCARIHATFFMDIINEFQRKRAELKAKTEKILTKHLSNPSTITFLCNKFDRILLNFDKLKVEPHTCRSITNNGKGQGRITFRSGKSKNAEIDEIDENVENIKM